MHIYIYIYIYIYILSYSFLIAASSATCTLHASRHFYEEEEGFGVEIVEGKVPEEGAQDDVGELAREDLPKKLDEHGVLYARDVRTNG